MNPMKIMQLKGNIDRFKKEHQKMLSFFKTISKKAMAEGSVLEIKVTSTEGKEYVANIKLTQNDMEIVKIISEMGGE